MAVPRFRHIDRHAAGRWWSSWPFGLCLLPLGYLAYQPSLLPRMLSILLVVSWIVSTLVGFLWPDLPAVVHKIIAAPPVAEFWMILYPVTKGVRVPRPDRLAPAAI